MSVVNFRIAILATMTEAAQALCARGLVADALIETTAGDMIDPPIFDALLPELLVSCVGVSSRGEAA